MILTFNTHISSLTQLVSGHMPQYRRRGGLVVERRTPEREAGGSILTQVAVLCP